jgi:hypothetical protein
MDTALQVREILSARGLTLYNVSRRSAQIFGRSSRFYVSYNLYSDLSNPALRPTIHQILALSHITRYRLADWLKIFGFNLDTIFRLQLRIPRRRTTILDSTVHGTCAWIPWFADRLDGGAIPSIAPLGHFLTSAPPRRARDLLALNKQRFRYGIIGEHDLYALPYFVPGSVIRADARRAEEAILDRSQSREGFFLVEHRSGWTCSRIIFLGKDRILLHCPQRPCAERELCIGKEARILGAVDAEIRPLVSHGPDKTIPTLEVLRKPRRRYQPREQSGLRDLLRRSRIRVGLSFREASSISRWIADRLSDKLYFTAASTLSDYEALAVPPRHIQKIITLCLLYCVGFHEFLRASGLPIDKAGREPIPDELLPRGNPSRNHSLRTLGHNANSESNGFLSTLMNRWEEVPLFLSFSLQEITGPSGVSFSNVFWVDGEKQQHPLLINATFVVVNRRSRKPAPATQDAICEEPLYLILKRDGSYLCGRCTLDEGNLVLHGYPGSQAGAQQFKDGIDAEVVGQVSTILRRLP